MPFPGKAIPIASDKQFIELAVNIPSIMISGGPMLAGKFKGEDIDYSTCYEAIGKYKKGKYT
ncbi:unnamed protein product, partial [marine sediment metagenome]